MPKHIYRPAPRASSLANWEKVKTLGTMLAAVVVPVTVAFVGGFYSGWNKDREVQGKLLEMAVNILKEPPDRQMRGLRIWSVDVLEKYSGIEMSADTRENLVVANPLAGPIGPSAAVRDVQAMLAALGYVSGPADGNISPALRVAIMQFQLSNGITPDGIMGTQTLDLLSKKFAEHQLDQKSQGAPR